MYLWPTHATNEICYLKPCKHLFVACSAVDSYEPTLCNYCANSLLTEFRQVYNTRPKRYLGIYVTEKIEDLFHLNCTPLLEKVKHLLTRWNQLSLSIIGQVALIRMSILPLFNFLFSTAPCVLQAVFFKEIDSMFSSFVWSNKIPRLALSTLSYPVAEGGLSLPNIRNYY